MPTPSHLAFVLAPAEQGGEAEVGIPLRLARAAAAAAATEASALEDTGGR
jgi:hypothetical protein